MKIRMRNTLNHHEKTVYSIFSPVCFFLFGWIYLIYKGLYVSAVAVFTAQFLLLIGLISQVGVMNENLDFLSWVFYFIPIVALTPFLSRFVKARFLDKGWVEL